MDTRILYNSRFCGAASILNGDFKMLAVLGVEDVLLTDLDVEMSS